MISQTLPSVYGAVLLPVVAVLPELEGLLLCAEQRALPPIKRAVMVNSRVGMFIYDGSFRFDLQIEAAESAKRSSRKKGLRDVSPQVNVI